MLRAVSQVFFFFKDKLRQCQPISNLHCSFLLPLKYEIIHCVANCWEEGTNVMWITLNTDLERDSAVKESLEAGGASWPSLTVLSWAGFGLRQTACSCRSRSESKDLHWSCNGFSAANNIFFFNLTSWTVFFCFQLDFFLWKRLLIPPLG